MFNIMYPNELLRGISNDNCIDEFGYPASNLFTFDNSSQQRTDGYKEESVTWRDDEKAVSILLNQSSVLSNALIKKKKMVKYNLKSV